MHSKTAIIIGSGVAGMATAIRLAVQGYAVKIFEKNNGPGGKIGDFEKEGYHFDEGPSLFTQPQQIEELFELAGEPIEKYFTYQSVDVACKYFYENGKMVNAYTNTRQFADELNEKVNESPGSVTDYLKQSGKLYENIGTLFLDHSLHKRSTWLNKKALTALATTRYRLFFSSMNKYNSACFKSPETIQLFNRFATYNGSSPFKTPGIMSLIPHLEMNQGTFYPHGGMISITHALYRLAKVKGVEFYFNNPVSRIIHQEGRVAGVVVNGENIYSGIVISNADVYFTYKNLLLDEHHANKLLSQERSSSAVIFYWGIKKTFPQLHLHNILFSSDYKAEFDCIFNKRKLSADPTIYINISSKMESKLAPPGKENWFVMVNAPANSGQDWNSIRKELRTNIINKLNRILFDRLASPHGITDMEGLIETEQIADPLVIEDQTAAYMGSLYGTSSNSKLAAFFRPANFTRAIEGLFFCGGSVHPGGGIPLCLRSAKIVSDLVQHGYK